MRKMRRVFWDALISLGLSWGIAHYLNPSDLEAKLILAIGIAIVCLIIILPIALHSLPKDKPWVGVLSLPLALSPLIILFSRPTSFFTPFTMLWLGQNDLAIPWALNGTLNSIFLIIIGYLLTKKTPEERPISWALAIFSTVAIMGLYAGIVYLGYLLY